MRKSARITTKMVKKALSQVIDPELNVDIVSLGLIYKIEITQEDQRPLVKILLTLTSPGCPLVDTFMEQIKAQFATLSNFEVETQLYLELTFDPPWVPDMMNTQAKSQLRALGVI